MIKLGRNLADPRYRDVLKTIIEEDSINQYLSVFLSYKSEDIEAAVAIGNYIKEAGINIYLDIYDGLLQRATQENDNKRIVECLQQAIDDNNHILCILSEETKLSWWVPYEIGYATRGSKDVSSVILKDIQDIPAYLEIAPKIEGINSLNLFLSRILKNNSIRENQLYKSAGYGGFLIRNNVAHHPLESYLEWSL